MRNLVLLLLAVCPLLFSCNPEFKDPNEMLELSADSLFFHNGADTARIIVTSNAKWKVSGINSWCTVSKNSGADTDTLTILIRPNVSKQVRSTNIVINTKYVSESIHIKQEAGTQSYEYKLPVVFHILYNDAGDTKQNIDSTTLKTLIQNCNAMYSGGSGVDFDLEFTLATKDPDGNVLKERGINRIEWPESITMNCDDFLKNPNNRKSVVWDMTEYINVTIFTFTEKNVLGVTVLPFTTSTNPLEGLANGDIYFTRPITEHTHCVCLNNSWIYSDQATYTLVHELGHYLGLYHAFFAVNNETDYCEDTPNYNRAAYENWLNNFKGDPAEEYKRTDFDGNVFISDNIMDYYVSHFNRFTADQYKRVRHVLENSPLIPGQKTARPAETRGNLTIPPYTIIR